MNSKQILNRQYEISPDFVKGANSQTSNLVAQLNYIWQFLAHQLVRSDEPRIWQTRDRSGACWWNAHDPISGRSLICASEEEVLIWLEQRPYC